MRNLSERSRLVTGASRPAASSKHTQRRVQANPTRIEMTIETGLLSLQLRVGSFSVNYRSRPDQVTSRPHLITVSDQESLLVPSKFLTPRRRIRVIAPLATRSPEGGSQRSQLNIQGFV
ncbi:hypothetical protein QCA50_008935 [Cerrena zonata]|uniref:Uncharacterized protein n=1 Tax=Cerrena zonata TaxID=2478898 RepID=A0AAW0G7X3_9APHY